MNSAYKHINSIFEEYTTESRVLRSFTNLSNTVIQTALSGQSKFVFELLQNADDAYKSNHKTIEVDFSIQDDFFIVQHDGKSFDYNDVERICDYASQIKEVKANDLSKTGYKGLGFKSLFNLSDTIYIFSNGYSFRFDKTFWPNPDSRPWQVIPIWCQHNELPLNKKISYCSSVNIILRVKDINQLKLQLKEVIDQPDLLLYLHRVNKLNIRFDEENYVIDRIKEQFGPFHKVKFYKNQNVESTWLIKSYDCPIPPGIQHSIQGGSHFIYPDKIKKAKNIMFTFALKCNEDYTEISKIKGLCYNTLPTQVHLMLPYHINSFFILNLDRTQLHENEWNEFLIEAIGKMQLFLLRDLTPDHLLKNYVISLLVREIEHPYRSFVKAFSKGFMGVKHKVRWLPSYEGTHLLSLGQVWNDKTDFFRHFENVYDINIHPYLIDHDVLDQDNLKPAEEVWCFTFKKLFSDFATKYYRQLTKDSYVDFISYIYNRLKSDIVICNNIRNIRFLVTKNEKLVSPQNAIIEDTVNKIPNFLFIDPINNECLPQENLEFIVDWLQHMGAKVLRTPCHIIQESVLKWIYPHNKINEKNHLLIIDYLAKNIDLLSPEEVTHLKNNLVVFTENKKFQLAKSCYLPDVLPLKELAEVVTKDLKLSSLYDTNALKHFFVRIGVKNRLRPMIVIQKVIEWIKCNKVYKIITVDNYNIIIEYVADSFAHVEGNLKEGDKEILKKFPVLTIEKKLLPAHYCFFDYAVPTITGLDTIMNSNELVSLKNESKNVYRFLTALGVCEKMSPVNVIRKSVIQWIKEGTISEKIKKENHLAILEYIVTQLYNLQTHLKSKEKNDLKKLLILTQGGAFKQAFTCYLPNSMIDGNFNEQIPGIESIISSDELVSSDYDIKYFKQAFQWLGVHNLTFFAIWERYINYLTCFENVKWFFQQLINQWKKNQVPQGLFEKLKSSRLLAKNNETYYSKDLYSSKFINIHFIDKYRLPILAYGHLPEDLELELGFKTKLNLTCIEHLYKALERKPLSGEKNTMNFFKILLEQLKSNHEIRRYSHKLLSRENKLVLATELNYFVEEEAECKLEKCYLKRIIGMSHSETLELAKLCGVKILPFNQKVMPVMGVSNNSLKEYYMERLPFIVFQEAKERNEIPSNMLKCLFEKVDRIKLYECQKIRVQYPFGKPVTLDEHFVNLTLYVVNTWKDSEFHIHNHIVKLLSLKTDIRGILDYEDIQELMSSYSSEDQKKIDLIQTEFKTLKLQKREVSCSLDNVNSSDDNQKVLLAEISSSEEETSDDESLYLISARETFATRSSVCETNEEVELNNEKVTIGVKCINVEQTSTSLICQSTPADDEAKSDSLTLLPNCSISEDVQIELNNGDFESKVMKCETNVLKKKTEVNYSVEDSVGMGVVGIGGLYAQNEDVETTKESVNNNAINEDIFDEDFNGNESRVRVCIGKYVFDLLQKHYIKKYSGARCNLLFNTFTLQWKFQRIDIVWLNGKEGNQHTYDFELRKNGDIKQLIRVELTDVTNNGSFILNNQNMITLSNKLSKDDATCYNFHVLREESSNVAERKSCPLAVYKIAPMK